jgi:hypothetical protein
MRIEKGGRSITCVADWEKGAPPKGANQWVEGRSAFELAHAWCGTGTPAMPAELRELFDSNPETRGMVAGPATPELRIPFDEHGGEPRNADLAFLGTTPAGKVAVTVEAKADEAFGRTVADTWGDALERLLLNPDSKGVERVEGLSRSLFQPGGKPRIADLRYQLLTAAAGTIAYAIASEASLAVLIVHEFVTSKTSDANHARNGEDYRAFLARLRCGSTAASKQSGGLEGPFQVPGKPLFEKAPPLLVGKITTNRRG